MRHQVAKGSVVLAVTRVLSRGFDFIALIVLARFLAPSDFGLIAIAMAVVQITEAIMEVPTGVALLQLRAVSRSYLNCAFTIALVRGIAIAVILCALAMPLAYFFDDERLFGLICVLALAPAVRGLRSPKEFLLFKHLRFRPDAFADVFGKFCGMAIAIVLVLQTESYWAIAAATVANPFFYVLATYALVPMRPELTFQHFRYFWGFIGWSMLAQTMSALNWQADRFLLGKLATQASVGLYATAKDLAALSSKTLMEIIQRPIMSAISRSNKQSERQRTAYGITIATVLSIGFPIACGQFLLAADIIRLILGPQWLEATIVFQAISLMLIPGIYSQLTQTLLMALGNPKVIFKRNLFQFLVRIPLLIFGITAFGWLGAIAAIVLADLFTALLCLHLAEKAIGITIKDQLGHAYRGLISVAAMTAAVLFLKQSMERGSSELEIIAYLLKIIPLAALTYCATHWVLWRLAGRPDGAETLVAQFIGGLKNRAFQI